MELKTIELKHLAAASWRFSEDLSLNHSELRFYSPIQHNIEVSLKRDGQIAPIHVRLVADLMYEVVDGHIVLDAAKKLGLTSLLVIDHGTLDDTEALLRYITLNLNRCGQYGHYHVKIHRTLGLLWPDVDTATRAARLGEYMSWPAERIQDYVELAERDDNWQKFMFVPKDDGEQSGFFAGEEHPVEDWQ
ncbi:Uncharacterised protein [uncultured archaeon]|nr:Uncharacterised protein [uncultured archaeon]